MRKQVALGSDDSASIFHASLEKNLIMDPMGVTDADIKRLHHFQTDCAPDGDACSFIRLLVVIVCFAEDLFEDAAVGGDILYLLPAHQCQLHLRGPSGGTLDLCETICEREACTADK